jgi:hypothetical protein
VACLEEGFSLSFIATTSKVAKKERNQVPWPQLRPFLVGFHHYLDTGVRLNYLIDSLAAAVAATATGIV